MTINRPSVVPGSPPSPFWTGLRIQIRVIHALVFHDAVGTHGHHGLGFFWVFGEPLALMTGISFLWSLVHITHGQNVAVIPFALTGYSFITLWRHLSGKTVQIMRKNVALRYHRHIKLFDVIVAKAVLETLALFSAFMVSYIPTALLGVCPPMSDPLALIGGFVFTGWFSFGFSLILASLSEMWEPVTNIIGAAMYITLPLTGAFTMQEWLPESARNFMAWSPLVNCIEMIRGGLFPADIPTHWSASYLLVCCLVITAIGFHLFRVAEKMVEQ